jgi:selenophosphate synthetase-related protein
LLAVSCDAAGGIGSKPLDKVRADPRLVGKMTARVALMELLATGADPIAIIGTFPVEPEPTANQVIEGIKEEVRNARLRNLRLLYSSEKNVKVNQTGIGITIVGIVSSSAVKIGRCEEEDEIIAVGEPYVGQSVIQAEKNQILAETLDVIKLRTNHFVHELIPVGSKGILYEARNMAEDSNLFFEPLSSQRINLRKSAGPATVLLCALRKGSFVRVKKALSAKSSRKIGTLRKR